MRKKFTIVIMILLAILIIISVLNESKTRIDYHHLDLTGVTRAREISDYISLMYVVLIGLLMIALPVEWMMIGQKWQFKRPVEPSEASVLMTRMVGYFIIAGLIIYVMMSNLR